MNAPLLNLTPESTLDTIKKDFEISGRTAIYRPGVTKPLRFLLDNNAFEGRTNALHFAKGKADHDTVALAEVVSGDVKAFDVVHLPEYTCFAETYSVIWSAYCANTLPPAARRVMWRMIACLLAEEGVAYVAVRSVGDKSITGEPCEDGFRNQHKGTFQVAYTPEKIVEEAKRFFPNVHLVQSKVSAGYLCVACSH